MAAIDKEKVQAIAKMLEGAPAFDRAPLQIYIKGTILGFPAILQALFPNWPFGLTYIVETQVINKPGQTENTRSASITIVPKTARGPFSWLTRIFLLESSGIYVEDKRLQNAFIINASDKQQADRFASYPGLFDLLKKLEKCTKFSEITIQPYAGVVLSQPQSFNKLELGTCREAFNLLSELGQIVFELF